MSPPDEAIAQLDLDGIQCTLSRRPGTAAITRNDGMQVIVREVDDQLVEVLYEQALHDTARERCGPAIAATFVRVILSRKQLEHVSLARG